MNTRKSFARSVISGLALTLALSGCVSPGTKLVCQYPMPPPDLMEEPPPAGTFRRELDLILDQGSTPSPTAATNSQPKRED